MEKEGKRREGKKRGREKRRGKKRGEKRGGKKRRGKEEVNVQVEVRKEMAANLSRFRTRSPSTARRPLTIDSFKPVPSTMTS